MYKKILAPLDSSKLSELSLEHVKKVAMATDESEVVLLMVLEPVSYLTYASSGLREDETLKFETRSRANARKYVDKVVGKLKKQGVNARGEVTWGWPADKILQYVNENKMDIVIMSTHGRSGIQRWALGSVADKVIRRSTVPVLIVPPQGFKDDEPATSKRKKKAS